ncbi:Interferon-induced protein 44-like [Mytilus coruscus]|uniref:Interferon-induced protein 44-like n=1 Tax=Mytilus coruscus TaxID=42192 RepID=A0A6J8DB04_MYTCO|nr:Interferon-induced protein 44-like [Mytilus coruscus]
MPEISKVDQKQITEWIGGRQKYTLLFKASRDGCVATTFHSKCNNKGATVTVLLYQNGTAKPVQFPVTVPGHAINDNPNYGPTFGGGHDLYTFNGTVNHDGTCYPLNGSANFGNSYNMKGENLNTICNGNLKVTDLEVYMVEELPNAPLENPWRRTPEWNLKFLEELKANIEHYKPLKELKIQQARILLVGQVGAGKSSFFNTINSIFRGYITSQACSGNAEHSLTTVYRTYQVRNGPSGKPMNFRLHDTRGLEADQGIDGQEISYIVDGHLPDRHQFNPSLPISPELHGFITSPQLSDKIHCVAFVMDSSTVDVLPEKVLERIKSLQTRLNQKGMVLLPQHAEICEIHTTILACNFLLK